MKALKALWLLLLLSGLIICLSGCAGSPAVIAEKPALAPLPAPPNYPAITWIADGPRLYLSTYDALELYNYLTAAQAWGDGVMAERRLYLSDKK